MALTKEDLKSIKLIVSEGLEAFAVITSNTFDVMEKRFDQEHEYNQKQFKNIDERFIKIDERFEMVDQRFEKIDERFIKIDERLNYQNQKMDQNHHELSEKIDRVTSMLSNDIIPLYEDNVQIKKRLTKLELLKAS